jgi:DNA-binding NarL/FixJ family response regulator
MSLLRLAQGRIDLALPAIRRALEEAQDPIARSRLLPACVEVMQEAEDVAAAKGAADELAGIAAQLDAVYVKALAAEASGAVLLADGDPRAALTKLRMAERSWRELEAPHQAARVRLLIGLACRELGDGASAELEFVAAGRVLTELGAAPDLERLARLAGSPRLGGLSRRESEVLTLVAAGKTNRAIAAELFISEKTVARHGATSSRSCGFRLGPRPQRTPTSTASSGSRPYTELPTSVNAELGVSPEVGAPLALYGRV